MTICISGSVARRLSFAVFAVIATMLSPPALQAADSGFSIESPVPIGGVTTGDSVLITIKGPSASALSRTGLRLNGVDVTPALQAGGTPGTMTGTVSGLQAGLNKFKLYPSRVTPGSSATTLAQLTVSKALAPSVACTSLANKEIGAADIGLPTTGATVTSATLVLASAPGNANGEYCRLQGAIRPIDQTAPNILFQLNLPALWNSRMLQMGGGGYNGTVVTGLGQVSQNTGPNPLALGYATGGTDSGHQDPTGGASFALNQEALLNYPGMHLKKMRDVSVLLINAYYGVGPAKFYFAGFSTGGREAMTATQRYPQDYDGVIAGAPTLEFTGLRLIGMRVGQAAYGPNHGFMNSAKQTLVQNTVMSACDALDGVADNIISNVSECAAMGSSLLASLRCAGGTDLGNTCLSDAQINLANTIATTLTYNYALANGHTFYPQYNYLEGALFLSSGLPLGNSPTEEIPPTSAGNGYLWQQGHRWAQYFVAQSTSFDPRTLDAVNPGPWLPRIQELSAIMDATNPDLTVFRAKGGKILWYHGAADTASNTNTSIMFYNNLVAKFSQSAVDGFVKFYTQPGMGHGDGTFVGSFGSLAALDAWAMDGVVPGNQVVTSNRPTTNGWTRPMCVWPGWPKYNGSGDIKVASSFTCVTTPAQSFTPRY